MTIKQAITRLEKLGIDVGYDTELAVAEETDEGFFFRWDIDFDVIDIPDNNGYINAITLVSSEPTDEPGHLRLIQ